MAVASTMEKIKNRAFELFQNRGGTHGNHMEDWLKAEKEVNESPKNNGGQKKRTRKRKTAKSAS